MVQAELLINNGERLVKLTEAIYTIGRSPDCDICIKIPSLSRLHAYIARNDRGEYIICDGDDRPSLNGTRVNGIMLKFKHGQILKHNDEITLSPLVSLRFFCINSEEKETDSTLL